MFFLNFFFKLKIGNVIIVINGKNFIKNNLIIKDIFCIVFDCFFEKLIVLLKWIWNDCLWILCKKYLKIIKFKIFKFNNVYLKVVLILFFG